MDTSIKVKLLGGTVYGNNLTGSCLLLTVRQGKNITRALIDAGLIQCGHKDFVAKNRAILAELKPEQLDYVILTHAHTDHIGRLPLLVKNGFNGKSRILCTEPTANILGIMLEDSANIQEIEIARLNKPKAQPPRRLARDRSRRALGKYDKLKDKAKNRGQAEKINSVLYDLSDVEKTCDLVKNGGCQYQEWLRLSHNVWLKFYQSGHVLGGAICVIRIKTRAKDVYFGFSGDLGRSDGIILPPAAKITEPIDVWFTESTYGGKTHPDREAEIKKLIGIVKEAVPKKQKIIIPSFALERAQEIIYLLSYYMQAGDIPKIKIYLDSPMAAKITDVFADSWDEGMFADQDKLKFNPFSKEANKCLKVVTKKIDSDGLIAKSGPYVVVAGSGMCEAGRVRSHLRAGLGDTNLIVCLVGYMVEQSLGNKLQQGLNIVRMNGQEIIIKAKIDCFDSFSAHADGRTLVSYARSVMNKNNSDKKIFIIHGDEKNAGSLKLAMMAALNMDEEHVVIPELNQEIVF
jgi:metallo-beta-lactamase family protein